MKLSRVVLISLFCLFASCAEKNAAKPTKVDTKAEEASKSAKPGSYGDWCEEHQVQESQCTRCTPSLAAAFKASNDWCVEHDLPESQCLKCNPNLKIERPPKE
jgi:hypothetical protein